MIGPFLYIIISSAKKIGVLKFRIPIFYQIKVYRLIKVK